MNDFIGEYWIFILVGGIAAVVIVAVMIVRKRKHSVKDVQWKPLIK
jgi:NADH:ubiquinone oxidoreductase subunit 6 (subunit J)